MMNGSGESLFNSPPVNFQTVQPAEPVEKSHEEKIKELPPHMQVTLAHGAPKPKMDFDKLRGGKQ